MKEEFLINFRLMQTSDINQVYNWTQESHVKTWWTDPEDWSEFRQKFENKLKSLYRGCFIIYVRNKPVGYIQYYVANKFSEWSEQPNGTYGMDLFIGDFNYIGKGYGTEIVKQFVKEIFKNLEAKRVIINPDINNIAAVRAYEKAGFKKLYEIKREDSIEILMEIISI